MAVIQKIIEDKPQVEGDIVVASPGGKSSIIKPQGNINASTNIDTANDRCDGRVAAWPSYYFGNVADGAGPAG